MKVRSSHVVIGLFVLVGAVLALAVFSVGPSTQVEPKVSDKTDSFLKEVRQTADTAPPSEEQGAIPGTTSDPTMVPKLVLSQPKYYVGTIANDDLFHGKFPIYNKGKAPLIIDNVDTECACTLGKMEKKTIPPGGTGILDVTVNPFRIPGFHSSKNLTITTNDPRNRMVTLNVSSDVKPEFELVPDGLDFGTIQKGTTVQKTMILRQLEDQPIVLKKVVPIKNSDHNAEISFKKRPESEWKKPGKAEYAITVKLLPLIPLGKYAVYFDIDTTCKRVPRMVRGAKATVVSFYSLLPSYSLHLGLIEPGQSTSDIATIESDKDFTVDNVKSSDSAFIVKAHPGKAPKTYVFDISATRNATLGKHTAHVDFVVKSDGDDVHDRFNFEITVVKASATQ